MGVWTGRRRRGTPARSGPTGPQGRDAPRHVAVVGAGIAGLTAAHELAVRGFDVTVHEAGDVQAIGGKARSFPTVVPSALLDDDATPAGEDPAPRTDVAVDRAAVAAEPGGAAPSGSITVPAEHGFRFFPGFYRYVIDSMRRIPAPAGLHGATGAVAADHLVGLREATIARAGRGRRRACTVAIPLPCDGKPPQVGDVARMLRQGCRVPRLRAREWPRFAWDGLSFAASLVRVITSSETRYWGELEERSWSEYIAAHRMLEESQKLFGDGLTRTFVATQADSMSARTGATILLQLLYDICVPDRCPGEPRWSSADRVLDGPTSDVWLQPWQRYLAVGDPRGGPGSEKRRPVTFATEQRVTGLRTEDDEVVGLVLDDGTEAMGVDEVVLAVPFETVQELLVRNPEVAQRATPLRGVFNLESEWMNGVLFYLREDLTWFPEGHVICLDSPWALTVVDQSQAWDAATYEERVGRHFKTLLSVDVSNWEAPSDRSNVPARFRQPPGDSVRAEVWRQLRDHFPDLPEQTPTGVVDPGVTRDGQVIHRTAAPEDPSARPDPGQDPGPGWVGRRDPADGHVRATREELRASNAEPLMVNTVGSWTHRPEVGSGMANLVVAGDFVRSSTDFASMEAANESARRAVDLICSRRTDRPGPGYRTGTAIPDLEGLVEPEVRWFAWPRDAARVFDRFVAHPLGWRAPLRAPLVAWAGLGAVAALRAAGRRARYRRPG